MYARLSALVCLLSVGAAAGGLRIADSSEVDLYLKSDGGGSAPVLSEMKNELASLMYGAGVHVAWWTPTDSSSGVAGDLVVIDLRGACQPPESGMAVQPIKNMAALASSAMADGRILPFSWVDCTAVNGFLSHSIAALSAIQREEIYGRALARLLAHELYHVITQSAEHQEAGLAKAQFSVADLIGARLEFFSGGILSKPRPAEQTARRWPVTQNLEAGN